MSRAPDPAAVVGQLVLDLSGLDVPTTSPAPPRRRRAVPAGDRTAAPLAPALTPAPPRVWGVWDGEDLVGVYAEEQVARADAAVLRREAVRAGVRASSVDCLVVPVLTCAQHVPSRR